MRKGYVKAAHRSRIWEPVDVLTDVHALKGAVAIDARSLSLFSQAQKEEVLKTALSGRAQIVIYHGDQEMKENLIPFEHLKNVRIIPQGLARAVLLLMGYPQVVGLFAKNLNPSKEIESDEEKKIIHKRPIFFQQIETREPGVLTAALLKVQYGDKYNLFKEENGAFILLDTALLQVLQDYLNRELIHQSA
jgi:hypothetical protein